MIYSIQRYCIHDGDGIRTVIFFKGCQLRCPWCANPESQSFRQEIGYHANKCIACKSCENICPYNAVKNGRIDQALCRLCGKCVDACPAEALQLYGKELTVQELVEEVLKDRKFYRKSGGGVTLSGGEAILQPDIVFPLLEALKEKQIHTALESNACFSSEVCHRLLPLTDQFLLDLKHMDSAIHEKILGMPNTQVLTNLKIASTKRLTIRIPLIPGFNDDDKNLIASAKFAQELHCPVDLLGYHNLGSAKYKALGREYPYQGCISYSPEQLKDKKEFMRSAGATVLD